MIGKIKNFVPDSSESIQGKKVEVQPIQFQKVNRSTTNNKGISNINTLMTMDLPITVELGRVQMMVRDILELVPGVVVSLNKFTREPVDIYINDKKFAEGEVVVVDQNFGVRITGLVGSDEILKSLDA